MKLHHRLTAVTGTLVLAWAAFMPLASADVTDDQIAAAKSEESKAARSVAQIEARLAVLEAEANELELASARAEVANSEAQSRLWDAMDAAEAAQIRANEAADKVKEGRAKLGRIGTAMYREGAGSITGGSYLLGADSLSDATNKAHAYDLVGQHAKTDLNEFQALQDVADALQKEADRCYQEEVKAAEEAERTARALEVQAAQAAERVAAIDAERDELVAILAQKRGVTQGLVRQQQQEKAAAARQAAAAEAARIRAAEQERQRQEAARVAQQQASRPKTPTPSTPTNVSGLGNQIVAYARQYIGVPYVWGGTSPTAGWDCSGFTQHVYRHFGISIPRTSAAIRSAGYKKIYGIANAKPGDLVVWTDHGHVGIYTGNGKHIAARRPGVGTQEGTLYGTYYFVRLANY